jgi:hypothetical protein
VVELRYPEAVENEDLTWRPARARIGGADVDGVPASNVSVGARHLKIRGEPGTRVVIKPGALRDPRGNVNENALRFSL